MHTWCETNVTARDARSIRLQLLSSRTRLEDPGSCNTRSCALSANSELSASPKTNCTTLVFLFARFPGTPSGNFCTSTSPRERDQRSDNPKNIMPPAYASANEAAMSTTAGSHEALEDSLALRLCIAFACVASIAFFLATYAGLGSIILMLKRPGLVY